MLCILRPHSLVFYLLRQNLQVLQKDNSCHTCEYWTNFWRCLPNMPIVLFMLFLSYIRGRKFLFCVCDVWGSNRYLCASLHSIWNNFAHMCNYRANIWGQVGGMYKLLIDTKKARNLHAFQPFLPFLLLFTIAGGNGGQGRIGEQKVFFGFFSTFSLCPTLT